MLVKLGQFVAGSFQNKILGLLLNIVRRSFCQVGRNNIYIWSGWKVFHRLHELKLRPVLLVKVCLILMLNWLLFPCPEDCLIITVCWGHGSCHAKWTPLHLYKYARNKGWGCSTSSLHNNFQKSRGFWREPFFLKFCTAPLLYQQTPLHFWLWPWVF